MRKVLHSTFSQLFTSFALIIVLNTLILVFYFYPNLNKSLVNRLYENNDTLVSNTQKLIDTQLAHIFRVPVDISSNNKLSNFYLTSSYFNRYKSISELKKYINSSTFIHEGLLFIADTTLLVSKRGINDLTNNMGIYYKDMDYTELLPLLKNDEKIIILPSQEVTLGDRKAYNVVTFILKVPKSPNKIMILVKESTLTNLLRLSDASHESDLFITDPTGQIIVSTLDAASTNELAMESRNFTYTGQETVLIHNNKYIVSSRNSSTFRLTYSTIVPYDSATSFIRDSQAKTILLIIIFNIVGFLAAYMLSKLNYSPIKQLVASFDLDANTVQDSNEYQLIRHQINNLTSECAQLNDKYLALLPASKEYLLHSLICGKIASIDEFNAMGSHLHLQLRNNQFQLSLVKFVPRDDAKIDKMSLLTSVPLPNSSTGYILRGLRKDTFIIFCCVNDQTQLVNYYKHLFDTLRSPHYHTLMSRGEFFTDLKDTNQHYRSALEILDYQILMGNSSLLDADGLPENSIKTAYPAHQISQLRLAVLNNHMGSVDKYYGELFNMLSTGHLSANFIRILAYDLFTVITSYASDSVDDSQQIEQLTKQIHSHNCSLDKMLAILARQHKSLVLHLKKQQIVSKNSHSVTNILAYMNEHYMDDSLSLQSIADHFEMSPSNLSHFFKKQTKVNFLTYLKHIRIDHAKELLTTTNLAVKEVSAEVGFNSISSFTRSFKDYVGQSPSSFRKENN